MMKALINLLIFAPAIGGLLCLLPPLRAKAKHIALAVSIVTLVFSAILTAGYLGADSSDNVHFVTQISWIGSINANYQTGIDGLNLPLVVLTSALSVLVVLAGWRIDKAPHVFHSLYLFLMTGMFGVFLALDLFLFYVFFEISLLPMYFLIGIWGGERREYAAIKFFLYTLVGSICLLIVMLGFFFLTGNATGTGDNTWVLAANSGEVSLQMDAVRAYFSESGDGWSFAKIAFWLTFIAFAVKVPIAPLHTWLPDAHVQAPTPISMILAGVLLKMGGYALMRVTYPIFPEAAIAFWEVVAGIGVFGIIYGALCAMAQTDWKKLVAYSSVSHMGYVTLGIAVLTRTGFDGAYYQMIAHGITSAMMFFLVGVVYERAHHRDLNNFRGIWAHWPGYSGWALVGFFAGMGLPGLAGFIGEIMVLLGTFQAAGVDQVGADQSMYVYVIGGIAAFGVVLTAGYILWMFQRVFMGPKRDEYDHYEPVTMRENFIMWVLGIGAFVFGIVPVLVFRLTDGTFDDLLNIVNPAAYPLSVGG